MKLVASTTGQGEHDFIEDGITPGMDVFPKWMNVVGGPLESIWLFGPIRGDDICSTAMVVRGRLNIDDIIIQIRSRKTGRYRKNLDAGDEWMLRMFLRVSSQAQNLKVGTVVRCTDVGLITVEQFEAERSAQLIRDYLLFGERDDDSSLEVVL